MFNFLSPPPPPPSSLTGSGFGTQPHKHKWDRASQSEEPQ